jgi:PAS domain S-box-containing protein
MVDPPERARLSTIYASLFVHSIDGFLLTAPDGRVLRANPRACELLGLSEEEIVQRGREGIVVPCSTRLPDRAGHRGWGSAGKPLHCL